MIGSFNNIALPGADKFINRLFRRVDGVVWDLMTGKVGIQATEGIAVLNGEGDAAQVEINLFDQFGIGLPAFAMSTPVDSVNVGDIIYFGSKDRPGWVVEKKTSEAGLSFQLMKMDGTRTSWKPPKVSILGMESGVMVLRPLTALLGGTGGLSSVQGVLLPMLMMDEGNNLNLEKMLPLMLMMQMGNTTNAGDGTANPFAAFGGGNGGMGNVMSMMMFMSMFGNKSSDGGKEAGARVTRFGSTTPFR